MDSSCGPPCVPPGHPSIVVLESSSKILANIIHTCYVELHAGFSSNENVMGCSPQLPSCTPKAEDHHASSQWEFKDSPKPWPNGFCLNMPLDPNVSLPSVVWPCRGHFFNSTYTCDHWIGSRNLAWMAIAIHVDYHFKIPKGELWWGEKS